MKTILSIKFSWVRFFLSSHIVWSLTARIMAYISQLKLWPGHLLFQCWRNKLGSVVEKNFIWALSEVCDLEPQALDITIHGALDNGRESVPYLSWNSTPKFLWGFGKHSNNKKDQEFLTKTKDDDIGVISSSSPSWHRETLCTGKLWFWFSLF